MNLYFVLLMGVSGSGKTTVGSRLAHELGWTFIEGDSLHPPENIAKMSRGEPLTDSDRRPWLDRLRAVIDKMMAREEPAVMAASVLKQAYRTRLGVERDAVQLVYLRGSQAVVQRRLAQRKGHFMPPALLASQFEALEEPSNALILDIRESPASLVAEIRLQLGL